MGLDFTLYKKRKEQSKDEFFEDNDYDKFELAYGRKSWELVYKLATSSDIQNSYGILSEDRWESLMRDMDPIGDLLPRLKEAYSHYDYYLNHYDDGDIDIIDKANLIFTNDDKKLIAQYEYWYEKTFDDTPTLGFDFSVGYMKSFYEAKDIIREILKDPDYEVLMSISY